MSGGGGGGGKGGKGGREGDECVLKTYSDTPAMIVPN